MKLLQVENRIGATTMLLTTFKASDGHAVRLDRRTVAPERCPLAGGESGEGWPWLFYTLRYMSIGS